MSTCIIQELLSVDTNTGKAYLDDVLRIALKMKRRVAAFLSLVFVVGVLLVPILHRAHCAACHDPHDAGQCPICQVANTPVVATAAHIEPVAQGLVSARIYLPQSLRPSAPLSSSAQARGPPGA